MRLGASLVPRVLAELTCLAVQEVRAITCPGPERFKIGPPEIEPVRTETIDCLQRLSEHDEIEAAILFSGRRPDGPRPSRILAHP
jgi:hypothetical protein